jgi:predicted DNA-binding transcriptional regulator YafY
MATPEEYGKKGTPLQHTRQSMILDRLNNGMELSITELSREWGVATKTLQRDFDKLNTMLPGQIERADDGKRYRKAKNYTAHNDGEIIIEMLDSIVQGIGGPTYTKAHKLLSELKTHIGKPFYARIDVEDISGQFELVTKLEKAMAEKRAVTLEYHRWYDDNGDKTYKDVHPFKIVVYNGFWYLLAEHDGYLRSSISKRSMPVN